MIVIGVISLLAIICTLSFKLRSRWTLSKYGYAQANLAEFQNPPQPPPRGGLFSSFARKPVITVNDNYSIFACKVSCKKKKKNRYHINHFLSYRPPQIRIYLLCLPRSRKSCTKGPERFSHGCLIK